MEAEWFKIDRNMNKLTVDSQLYNFSYSSPDAITCLTKIKPFSIFFNILQE